MDKARKNVILTSYLQSIINSQNSFIASKIAPIVKVNSTSGDLLSIGKQGLRVVKAKRSMGGRYKKVDFTAEIVSGRKLEDQGLHSDIYTKEAMEFESQISVQQAKSALLNQIMMLNYEEEVASLIDTSNITNNVTLSGTAQWNDTTNSNPVTNIMTAIESVRLSAGKKANAIAMSRPVFNALKVHPKVKEYFTGISIVTDALLVDGFLKNVMGFTYVNIAEAVYNDANLTTGIDNGTLIDVRGKKCLVYYYNDMSSIMDVSFMNTFNRNGDGLMVSTLTPSDKERKLEGIDSTVLIEDERDVVLTYQKAAYLIENAIA